MEGEKSDYLIYILKGIKCCSFQPAISAGEIAISNKVEIQKNSFNLLEKEWPKYK